MKATPLSEAFDYTVFRTHYGDSAVPMLLITEDGDLKVITTDDSPEPAPGDTLVSLVREPAGDSAPKQAT